MRGTNKRLQFYTALLLMLFLLCTCFAGCGGQKNKEDISKKLLYLPNPILAGFFEGEGALEVLKGEAVSIPLNVCGAGTVLIIRECIRCRHDHKPADALFLISVTRREICIK